MYSVEMEHIRKLKEKLAKEVLKSDGNLCNPSVVKISQQMDKHVVNIQRSMNEKDIPLNQKTGS